MCGVGESSCPGRAAHPESCACTLGAGGAQSGVRTGTELVLSVEMSPMVQRSKVLLVSPFGLAKLCWCPDPCATSEGHLAPQLVQTQSVPCTAWPHLCATCCGVIGHGVCCDTLGSCSRSRASHKPLLPRAVGEQWRPGAGHLLFPQEGDPLGDGAGSWG